MREPMADERLDEIRLARYRLNAEQKTPTLTFGNYLESADFDDLLAEVDRLRRLEQRRLEQWRQQQWVAPDSYTTNT